MWHLDTVSAVSEINPTDRSVFNVRFKKIHRYRIELIKRKEQSSLIFFIFYFSHPPQPDLTRLVALGRT